MQVVKVKNLKESCCAYCAECNEFFQGVYPWHYSKSKALHERGVGHKVVYMGWAKAA